MGSENFNCYIDEMHTHIIHQCKWESKSGKDEFIDQLGCDYNHIDLECFNFHWFHSIMDSYQIVPFYGITTNKLDGANKIQPPLHEGLCWQCGHQFCNDGIYQILNTLVIITRLTICNTSLCIMVMSIKKCPPTPWCISYKTMGIYVNILST